jgi:hypothetical protein
VSAYRINEPAVISEVIEGEAIILNFESGTYYSLNESARSIWQDLAAGVTTALLAERLGSRYGPGVIPCAADIRGFVAELEREQLIVAAPDRIASTMEPAAAADGDYESPQLEKFTDLQELLLLDPIHEMDEAGRPL